MKRKIITIDEEKCNGCGLCVNACHEGAIELIDGKAKLTREDFCDGLGDCLPNCPQGAISFEEREALSYNEEAVKEHLQKKQEEKNNSKPFTCPGMAAMQFKRDNKDTGNENINESQSQLMQWPCQIKLMPVKAPYYEGAELLVAADCTAYAYASFHERFMKDKITVVGCPKLDDIDYSQKLGEILTLNDIKKITLVRMEVPCCGGLLRAVANAVSISGKDIPLEVFVISTDGKILK